MRIHALTTGTVSLKHAFLYPGRGPRRQLDLFLPGPFSEPMPIHCWAIEHDGRLLLVDCGETAAARNIPFARFEITREQELPGAMAGAGLSLGDVSEVVLTHHHGDHVDGLLHVHAPVRITLDGGPFGGFRRSRALSEDGRIVAVATPGHTPGHVSVICIDDAHRHVMLAGDATDSLEQLEARRADAVGPEPKTHVATLETILAHCAQHPTVYLPSHDPESADRLAGAIAVASPSPAQ
jgi:N-acyl homoserine lactone hydrolase